LSAFGTSGVKLGNGRNTPHVNPYRKDSRLEVIRTTSPSKSATALQVLSGNHAGVQISSPNSSYSDLVAHLCCFLDPNVFIMNRTSATQVDTALKAD
jgi:hypothetical protein